MAAMHKTCKIYEDTVLHVVVFFFVGDSIDVRSSIHICALLVFACGNMIHLPKEKHGVIIHVIL